MNKLTLLLILFEFTRHIPGSPSYAIAIYAAVQRHCIPCKLTDFPFLLCSAFLQPKPYTLPFLQHHLLPSSADLGQDMSSSLGAAQWEVPVGIRRRIALEEDLGHILGHHMPDHHSPEEEEGEDHHPIVRLEAAARHKMEEGRRSLGEGQAEEGLGCSQSSTVLTAEVAGCILLVVRMEGRPGYSRSPEEDG